MQVHRMRQIIYRLKKTNKRVHGYHIREATRDTDFTEGTISTTKDYIVIKNMVMLPAKSFRDFARAVLAQATSGGFYNMFDTVVIIDSKDLPIDFVIKQDDKFQINNKMYEVHDVTTVVGDVAHLVKLRGLQNVEAIIKPTVATFSPIYWALGFAQLLPPLFWGNK